MKNILKRTFKKVDEVSLKIVARVKESVCNTRGRLGTEEIIGITIGLIVAAFILLPGLRDFADSVITAMKSWWTATIQGKIFPTS